MRRFSLWMRRHPIFGDSIIAAVIALLDLAEVDSPFARHYPEFFWPVGALLIGPLVLRRRYPLPVAWVIGGAGVVQVLTHGNINSDPELFLRLADLSLPIMLYTVLAYVGRRPALAYGGFIVVGTLGWTAWRLSPDPHAMFLGLGCLLVLALSWVFGEMIGARRAYDLAVRQRLETERDQHARIAVAAERTRIARELHDVVAHAVSVIVVQSDGARYAIRGNPDLAESAVRTISATGREALVELRQLLDVLRGEDEDAGAQSQRAPQPGVAGLPELVDKVSAAGLPVSLQRTGELSALPAGVGLGVYRIVQEALTNSLKHAGAGATAAVRVRREGELVEVEVRDDGRGRPGRLSAYSGGNGLIGMRERASVLGGSLEAGPLPAGGWRVCARFPVRTRELIG